VDKIVRELLNGYDMGVDELVEALETDPKNGLSSEEATRRLHEYGSNKIPEVEGNFWQIYLAPLFNILITTYLLMSFVLLILALAFHDPTIRPQATMWLSVVVANFLIAIMQQRRAQKKFAALRQLTQPTSRVIRNGTMLELPAVQLVPGDLIELEQGNRFHWHTNRLLNCLHQMRVNVHGWRRI